MSEDKTYNGWTNYETWDVKLWLDNEEGTYSDMRELAKSHSGDKYQMSKAVREYVENMMPDIEASMFSDLLLAALSDVNWYEIGEAYLEGFNEE